MRHFVFILTMILSFNASASINSSGESGRGNSLLRFIANHPGLRQYALYSVISNRCNRHMPYEKGDCKRAVKRELEILDFDILFSEIKNSEDPTNSNKWVPSSFVFVAFKQELIDHLNHKNTEAYLRDLNFHLTQYLTGEIKDANIWNVTMKHFKNELHAAGAIAVLLQDTSPMKLHLAYLDKREIKGRPPFAVNKELLAHTIDTISMVLDYTEKGNGQLFYQPSVKNLINKTIYHFYVPYYLAMKLVAEGHSKRMAHAAPFLMTLSYEFITHAEDYRYLIKDHTHLDPIKDAAKLTDIHGGYTGAALGAQRYQQIISLDDFKTSFQRSTQEALFYLLRN